MGGADGRHDLDDVPFAIQRLEASDHASRNIDGSGMGPGPERDKSIDVDVDIDVDANVDAEDIDAVNADVGAEYQLEAPPSADSDAVRVVRRLPYNSFRACLVEHFDIIYQQKNRIEWPSRNSNKKISKAH